MGIKRLLLELLVALLLARFAMVIGDAYAGEAPCTQGLPALAWQTSIQDHVNDGGCMADPAVDSQTGGPHGHQR